MLSADAVSITVLDCIRPPARQSQIRDMLERKKTQRVLKPAKRGPKRRIEEG